MEETLTLPEKSLHGVSFFCTKVHKWRGLYTRIITIGNEGFATYSTEKSSLTNFWAWKDIENIEAEKPGSFVFTVTVRNGKSTSKISFRSQMIAEILSEARSHLLSEPAPYLFIGSKVHCRDNKEKEIEFIVKNGYILMHLVDENRTKIIPIHHITDVAQMNDSGEILLEVCGKRRYYQLRERFGFITALVKEMNLCGIDKDARQRFMADHEQEPLLPIQPSNHLTFPVYRIHSPQSPLSSMETPLPSNERLHARTLYLTHDHLEEVIEREDQYEQIHSIEYSAIVGYYQAMDNETDFYIQFQSHGYLRLLAFACDCRDEVFFALQRVLPTPPLFVPFLPNNTLRFRGTGDHITDMANTCIRAIQTHLPTFPVEPHRPVLEPTAGKTSSTLSFGSLVAACEAFLINSRYFTNQYSLSSEERKDMISRVKKTVIASLELIRKEKAPIHRDVCVLFLFLKVFILPDTGLPPSTYDPSFTNLFAASCQVDDPCIQLCHLQLLLHMSQLDSYPFLTSFVSSTILLKNLVHTTFSSQVHLFSLFSIQLLIQLIKEQATVHPSPVFAELSTFIASTIQSFYTLLLTPSYLQSSYFTLFYHLILYSNDSTRDMLQTTTLTTDTFLEIMHQALFTEQPLQRLQAQAILILVALKNTTVLTFLQRILPKEFSRVLHSACSVTALNALVSISKEGLSLADSLVYNTLADMEYPKDSLNFPAFFSLFASDTDSYCIVWGPNQREEVKQALVNEMEKWKGRKPHDIWNGNQFFIPFPSYDQHLQLYGYFLTQLSRFEVSAQCSGLMKLFDITHVKELPSIKLLNPCVLFLSLYARYLAATTQEHQAVCLRCMRVVYVLYSSNCGEFFDCFHLLELYEKEDNLELQICLLELIQCLCMNDKNKDFFCRHASQFIPVLLKRLYLTHVSFDENFCLNAIDVLYTLLCHTAAEHMFPPSDLVLLLTQKERLLQFVNLMFLPSEALFFYIVHLLLTLVNLSGSILSILSETPIIDCLLIGYQSWRVEHIKLLKLLIMKENPLLGLLPNALLYGLDIASESQFITAFQSDTVSAKMIWTEPMRVHLLDVLHLHSDSYKALLTQDPSAAYSPLPLPHIPYEELKDEIYCGKYYLQQLLMAGLSVTIKNPSALLVSIKNEWLREGKRKGYSISIEQAMEVLGVSSIPEEYELYKIVWEKWHQSDDAQRTLLLLAEDLLSGYLISSTTPVFARLLTLIQVQKELYLLYKTKLKSSVYPAYDIIAAQTSLLIHHVNREEASEIVLELCRLIFYSCNCSPENSEEFVRKNGVYVLRSLMEWNDRDLLDNDQGYEILYSILLTLIHLSEMISVHSVLIGNQDITLFLVKYLSFSLPPSLKLLMVDYFMNLIIEPEFRTSLYHLSVNLLNTAIPLLFLYNHDEDESREKQLTEQCIRLSTSLKHSSRSSSTSDLSLASDLALSAIPGQLPPEILTLSQKASSYLDVQCDTNMLARRVFELLSITVNNWSTIVPVLNSLLTKSLVSLLEAKDDSFLIILNEESYSSPFIIWSSEMKSQLLDFLNQQLTQSLASENHFIEDSTQFVFTAIQHELIIADVYVRVFNEQRPEEFVKGNKYLLGILQYLIAQKEKIGSVIQEEKYVKELLLSVEILLSNNPDLECYFKSPEDLFILFSFLLPSMDEEDHAVWDLTSQSIEHIIAILTILAQVPRIAVMIVESQFIDILLRLLYQHLPYHYDAFFAILYHLCTKAEGKEPLLVNSMVWLYVLYCTLQEPTAPIAAQALSILQYWYSLDTVHARFVLLLRHFLPEYIIRMIPQESFLQLISTTTLTAEIIWDKAMMEKLMHAVTTEYEHYRDCFLSGSHYELEGIEYDRIKNELVVGNVFIRVYNAGSYKLSNPSVFMAEVSRLFITCIENELSGESKPKSIEEERQHKDAISLYETAILKYCELENTVSLNEFVDSGVMERLIQLWEEMRQKQCLHSPSSTVICSVLMKLSKNVTCLTRIVSTSEVLHTLLDCLKAGTSNCTAVAYFLYLLFKAKSTELCKFVDELKVVSSLLACFKNPIKIQKEDGEEDVEKENEILMNIQRTLVCIEKIQIMNADIATQLEENGWNDFKNVNYTIPM